MCHSPGFRDLYPEEEIWPSYLSCHCGCVHFAIDIGCSLIKMGHVFNTMCTENHPQQDPCHNCQQKTQVVESVKFVSFSISDLDQCLEYAVSVQANVKKKLRVTTLGVGTMKYRHKIRERLKIDLFEVDEFTCFSKGFHLIMTDDELVHKYSSEPPSSNGFRTSGNDVSDERFPAVLCVAGSTANFIKVERTGKWSYLHNDSRCGIYFHSLGKLLTGCRSYSELMSLADEGQSSRLSVCLDEILTEKYAHFNTDTKDYNTGKPNAQTLRRGKETLPFGRILTDGELVPKREDLARSLLHSVVDGLLNVGILLAREVHTDSVHYVGSFMHENQIARAYLNLMPEISMHGDRCVRPTFFNHGGYIGVLGALILSLDARGSEIRPD